MNKTQSEQIDHDDAYNDGWNRAANEWGLNDKKFHFPRTKYKGAKRESFIEGFNASIDNLLLQKSKDTESLNLN